MYAYDEYLLNDAQTSLGWMFDYGVNDYGLEIETFYQYFLNSSFAERFGKGDSKVVAGMSGTEIAMEILGEVSTKKLPEPAFRLDKTPEYWTGWALAYYQWDANIGFRRITEVTSISSICLMYKKYHEMDISHFVDEMNRKRDEYYSTTALKRFRTYAGVSQKELAARTGIPLKTIQQYEQGQKDIRKANVDYLVRLSKSLYCSIEELL